VYAVRVALAFIAIVGGLVGWLVGGVSMIQASRSRAPGAPRPAPYEGRFDVMYRPELLTPEGRRHRRRCLLAVAGGVLCWAVGMVGWLLGLLPVE
jgi:hypothetical protein